LERDYELEYQALVKKDKEASRDFNKAAYEELKIAKY
jgi:hypothetical protein